MEISTDKQHHAIIMAGIPAVNLALYHRIRFMVGDPAAYAAIPRSDGTTKRVLICRDIEMDRAREHAAVDSVRCPADFAPQGGLSGDRETATAQALAEMLVRENIRAVTVDRSLPYSFANEIASRGIGIEYDPDLGVSQRRRKDPAELKHIRHAQAITEQAMRMACETVANAVADAKGVLHHDGNILTSERLRTMIDMFCLSHGASNPHGSIVAGGIIGADCHHRGEGPLSTGQPVMIDIFPMIKATHYNGDCTRTVVHGEIPQRVATMHATVIEAKDAAEKAIHAGATGDEVHAAAIAVIRRHGFEYGIAPADASSSFTSMPHGTGHGIGLEVHEPPLLDRNGPVLVEGDVLTVEPGLYSKAIGGVRVEDMVVVTAGGCENINTLPVGMTWS
jgi:Xaa-Pro aminopeptidase